MFNIQQQQWVYTMCKQSHESGCKSFDTTKVTQRDWGPVICLKDTTTFPLNRHDNFLPFER